MDPQGDAKEYGLLAKQQGVCIFKLPPMSTSKGYYLDDWKEMMWEGGIKITDKNNVQMIYFMNKDGSLFASCPVAKNYQESVQKTIDSSRGAAVRLVNPKGGFTWIGVAFRDRNDAFDFMACVQEFQEKKQYELNPEMAAKKFQNNLNFQLAADEKLVFTAEGAKVTKVTTQQNVSLQDFKFSLPGEPQPKVQTTTTAANNSTSNAFTDFSDWGFGATNAPQATNNSTKITATATTTTSTTTNNTNNNFFVIQAGNTQAASVANTFDFSDFGFSAPPSNNNNNNNNNAFNFGSANAWPVQIAQPQQQQQQQQQTQAPQSNQSVNLLDL